MENMTLGTFIKNARIAKGYSQQDLSDVCGITRGQISQIENGKSIPYLLTLKSLCISLDIDFNEVSKKYGYNNSITENINSITTIIRNARTEQRLSQQELSKITSLTQVQISNIENGKSSPKVSSLQKICKALNINMKGFLFLDDDFINIANFPEEEKIIMRLFCQKFSNLSERDKSIIRLILDSRDA